MQNPASWRGEFNGVSSPVPDGDRHDDRDGDYYDARHADASDFHATRNETSTSHGRASGRHPSSVPACPDRRCAV